MKNQDEKDLSFCIEDGVFREKTVSVYCVVKHDGIFRGNNLYLLSPSGDLGIGLV